MSDEVRVRKDGRPLVTEHPLAWQDMIDVVEDVEIPEDAIVCRRSREPAFEAWMWDV